MTDRSTTPTPRFMGLDVGTRTVGIAISDRLGITAQPRTVLRRTSMEADLAALQRMAKEEEITAYVVGLPRRTTGEEGPEATNVRNFANLLAERTTIPVHYIDERFTTAVAQAALLEGDVSRAKRRASVDKVAAALILQSFLDLMRREQNL